MQIVSGRIVYGVAVNEGSRPCYYGSTATRQYTLWKNMLNRCVGLNRVEKDRVTSRRSTYVGINISHNFLSYEYFYDWCLNQIGFNSKDENGCSYQLDKDILCMNDTKIYSEDTCVFVPKSLNFVLSERGKCRGEFPIGVSFDKSRNKFISVLSVNGKPKFIGRFDTAEEAHNSYKEVKSEYVRNKVLEYMNLVDDRVISALIKY